MDERLRRDNSENKDNINSNPAHGRDFQQWNYSENVSSNAGADKINPSMQKAKRFEVHIPESEAFPANRVEAPARVPAPVKRPAAPTAPQPVRPVNGTAPTRPAANRVPTRPTGVNAAAAPKRPNPAPGARPPVRNTNPSKAAPNSNSVRQPAGSANKPTRPNSANSPAKKKNIKRKKSRADFAYNFTKNTLITCVCFIFIATLATVASSIAFGFINDILVIDKENKDYSVVVEIPVGAEYDQIFDILEENGLVNQPLLTDFFLKFRHYDYQAAYDDETGELLYDENGNVLMEAVKYAPGVYYLYADSGIENILDSMLVNNSVNKGTVRLTFPEGWTTAEIFEKIEKAGVCEAEKLYANLDIVAQEYSFIKKLAEVDGRFLKGEGYLFPDTYDFYIGENASSVLGKLLSNFEARWEKEYNDRLKELGITMDEAIIIASIIQCEARDGTEMPTISGITYNRLADKGSFPTIGMDSTSDYIDLLYSMNIITTDQLNFYRPLYSTYESGGLPPGPICNPGASAIRAALYPEETEYKFFCHDSDGNIYYASNAAEHEINENIAIYGAVGGN